MWPGYAGGIFAVRGGDTLMAKEKKQPEPKTYLCSECGKEISGDHVHIKTRRRTELHIHFECMRMGRKKHND